jgi:homoserine kinase
LISKTYSSCIAVASASTANLGPGYDVFGLGLDACKDRVEISKVQNKAKRITIRMSGEHGEKIPSRTEANSAGIVIKKMLEDFGLDYSLNVDILKGVPTGYGMGSSAASAAAAAMAFDGLFDLKIKKTKLVEYAAEGEIASAGTRHYDNVSGSVLGGFIIVRTTPELEFIKIEPPKNLVLVIAVPMIKVPRKKTAVARSLLPEAIPLKSVIHNVSNASTVVAGFILKDIEMIAKGIDDIIVEPARSYLTPNYEAVKRNALKAGALAVTISGAGPSMISITDNYEHGKKVADAMATGFKVAKIASRTFVCHSSKGAKIVDRK